MRELSIIVAFSRDHSIIVVPLPILILKGERAPKNAIFWSKFSKKCLKTPFWPAFHKILPMALWFFIVILESSENQFG